MRLLETYQPCTLSLPRTLIAAYLIIILLKKGIRKIPNIFGFTQK